MATSHVQHIGSLIRPTSLTEAVKPFRATFDTNSSMTPEQKDHVKTVTESAIREVVQQQLSRNITPITSGEFERTIYYNGLFENLSGFETKFLPFESEIWRQGVVLNDFMASIGISGKDACIATGKIQRARPAYLGEWRFLRSCLPEEKWKLAKITVLTPLWWHQMLAQPYTTASGYTTDEDYLGDIVYALRKEIMELYSEGLRQVQIDDPILAWFYSPQWAEQLKEAGTNVDELIKLYVKAHAQLTHDLPKDLVIGHHMCRGNAPGDTMPITGSYEEVAKLLFAGTEYSQFCVEHINEEKHGDFSFLQALRPGQKIVLGLISTKFAELENVNELKKRVLEAADVIARAQGRPVKDVLRDSIALSPQCGFSSQMDYSAMTMERQWEKMALLHRLAEDMWSAEQ